MYQSALPVPRSHHIAEISRELVGREVSLVGWVYRKRVHGGLVFIILRDGSSATIQCTIHRDRVPPEDFKQAEKTLIEAAVWVQGVVAEDPRAPGGLEVRTTRFRELVPAEPWPLTEDAAKSVGFLYDKRHLWLRSLRVQTVLRARAEFCKAAREFFEARGFVEIHAPILITTACEGGATLFPVEYFDREAYLTQSAQLYEEAAIAAFEKVYTIGPSFRAEKSRTRKHLTEFWQIEAEVAYATMEDIMRLQEDLLSHLCNHIAQRFGDVLGERADKIRVKPPFPKITYDEAVEIAQRKGYDVPWGEDFGAEAERAIAEEFEVPFFIYDYPLVARSFYCAWREDRPEIALSCDLWAPEGFGEIATGGERIADPEVLRRRIIELGLPLEQYEWYIEIRRYGLPRHAGFGIGVERTLRWMFKLDHVRMVALFPRTPTRVEP